MYAELINKYRATNKLKIVEVNAKDFSEIDTKIFLRELNAGEKMHLYFIFENDLKNASEDEKLLFALNMALCDSEGNRTEKDENYSLLCDLPNDLLQKLLEENTKLLTMSESEKKISAVRQGDRYSYNCAVGISGQRDRYMVGNSTSRKRGRKKYKFRKKHDCR